MVLILITSVVCLLVLFLAGPRVKMQVKIDPGELPGDLNDLDKYLMNQEQKAARLIPGAEKKIIWAGPAKEKTEFSLLYLHGFSASRQEISPVTETIAQKLGANIFFTRLKGHGQDELDALGRPVLGDWLNDAWEAYEIGRRIGHKVIVIGVSAGGTLALWLNTLPQNIIAANIIISPCFELAERMTGLMLLPWGNVLLRLAIGKYYAVPSPVREERFRKFITVKYPAKALLTLMSLCKFSWKLKLADIQVPTLCLYTDNDQVVSVPRLKAELSKIDDKYIKLVRVDAKHHCLTGDAISPETNEVVIGQMLEFLSARLDKPAP